MLYIKGIIILCASSLLDNNREYRCYNLILLFILKKKSCFEWLEHIFKKIKLYINDVDEDFHFYSYNFSNDSRNDDSYYSIHDYRHYVINATIYIVDQYNMLPFMILIVKR